MIREATLYIAAGVGILGTLRFSIGIYANYWYNTRVRAVKALSQWECSEFHNIMFKPRPLAVIINDWLEVHHV